MTSQYAAEESAASVSVKDGQLHIAICGEKTSLSNFWSGKFLSSWLLQLSADTASISGEIKVW